MLGSERRAQAVGELKPVGATNLEATFLELRRTVSPHAGTHRAMSLPVSDRRDTCAPSQELAGRDGAQGVEHSLGGRRGNGGELPRTVAQSHNFPIEADRKASNLSISTGLTRW